MPFRTAKTRVYQYDIIVKGSRFRGSCGTEDYEEAKAVEAQIRANAKALRNKGGSYTLSEALGTYHRDKIVGTSSEATNAGQCRAILKHMDGRQQISNITDADVLAYVAKDRAKCKNATVNRRLQMLGRAIRHMGSIYKADIPTLNLKAAETKEPREIVRELSADEQRRLFDALPAEYHPIVSFALMTGARIGSITSLLWDNVDMNNREISFWVKGDERLTFPINREVAALLSALPRSNVLAHRKYVFTRLNKQTLERQPIDPHGGILPAAFRKALAGAEIEGFRFHDLRHTFATRLLRKTQNIKLVSKLLGHSNIETTTKYAHVLMDDMRHALDDFSVMGEGPKMIDPQNNPQTGLRPQAKSKG